MVILVFGNSAVFAAPELHILFLPLVARGGVTPEICEQTTRELAAELIKLDLFKLTVSDNWLAELQLDGYMYYYENLQKRIMALGSFDYILSGYLHKDEANSNYELGLVLTNFSKRYQEYNKSFLSVPDIKLLIKSQVDAIKKHKSFIPDQAAVRDRYEEILKNYSPATYPIIERLRLKDKNFDILEYILPAESPAIGIATAVHEGNHVYARTSGQARHLLQYIGPEEEILLAVTETFPSRELVAVIPERLRTFRFKTYIVAPITSSSTQSEGIYGLLNEFNSYYQSARVSCDLLSYYKDNFFNSESKFYYEFLRSVYVDYFAYYEFKFFIETYLLYAKKEKPAIYKKLKKNAGFLRVFQKLDAAWVSLLHRVADMEDELNDYLEERGMHLRREGKYTYIGSKTSRGYGLENYQDTIELLSEELNRDVYQALEKDFF